MNGKNESIRILFVDDDPDLAEATARFLEREDPRFEVETAPDAREGKQRLDETSVDCVVSDYEMPGQNGVEFLEDVRRELPNLPFILYTGRGSEEVASEAISAGVTDYLQKGAGTGQYAVLANRIGNAVEARRSALERERIKDDLTEQNRALRRLYEISADQTLEFRGKMRALLELGVDYLGTETGLLAHVDFDADRLEVVEAIGANDRLEAGETAPLSETYCCRTLEADGVLQLADALDEGWENNPAFERWNFRTYIGNTVQVHGEQYGTLCFVDRAPRSDRFDEAERTFVDLANQWLSYELERRQREQALQEYNDYTDKLLDAIDDLFYVVDRDHYFERWNDSVREVTGYSDAEIREMPAFDFFPDDCNETVREAIREVFETGSVQIELPLETKGGDTIPYEFIADRVTDPDGEPKAVGIGRDITDHVEYGRALERERDRLDALFHNLPNPVAYGHLTEDAAVIRSVNPTFEETFGCDAETVDGTHLHDLVLMEDQSFEEVFHTLIRQLQETGEVHAEVRRQTVDGPRDFQLDATIRRSEEGPHEGYAIYTDITEHKERERRREQRYEAIFNHAYQFAGLLEPDGTLIEANRAALEISEVDAEDVLGEPFWAAPWWQVDDQTPEQIRDAVERAADGEFVRFETRNRTNSGEIIVDFSIRPITDEDGEIIYLLPEGRNITELKALKERERALERQNKRLDEFAGVVSHDLRSPLNAAVTHLELARQKYDAEELESVARAHERMQALIDDVLALARQGQTVTSTEPIELAELFEAVAYDLDTADATLAIEADQVIRADKRRLHRLLTNLLRNAVEHGGPEVTVRIGDLPGGFYLEDDGPGIPEDDREEVFETGYTTAPTGTGFGLSIAREIAGAHDWEIRATESAEGGARFEITGVESI